ncbi:MAG: hypothetical protein LBH25_01265, partial [Fibromonadaceae bacterium]|nr:hypothetical protein [Fibromonadaceae bacterium]
MPEIEFYITDDERMELFDYVTSNEGMFVPDLWYNKPEGIRIQSKAELIKCIDELVVGFYVISSRFQTEPLMLDALGKSNEKFIMERFQTEPFIFAQHIEKKGQGEGKCFIMQRYGGPYISFSFYRGYADDAPIKCKCTDISHYARYIHHNDFEL